MAKILIVGCGALGRTLAVNLTAAGHAVTGLKRTPSAANHDNFQYCYADITQPLELINLDTDFEFIFFIVAPDSRNENSYSEIYEHGLENVLNKFVQANSSAPWIFVSSTSVYGQSRGEWVDEGSPTIPEKLTSAKILNAEQKLVKLNPKNVIVRFSGIYGPGREYLLRMAKQSPAIQQNPPYYTNRIHQDDCVNVLQFLLEQQLLGRKLEQCYLASDNDPAPLWDVVSWLAEHLGSHPPVPKEVAVDCDLNKRCKNKKLIDLGYAFRYPDYKAGYSGLILEFNKHLKGNSLF